MRGRLTAALATLVVAVGLAVGAQQARALELGIADSDPRTVLETYWDGLGIDRVRIVVPWDVATTTGRAGVERRRRFEEAVANAAAKGVRVLVTFGPSEDVRVPGTGDAIAPTADEFAAAFAAFLERYPTLRTIAAWNEPNNVDVRNYPLGSSPQLAAQYFVRAKALCPSDCVLVAGDFAGIPNDDAYVDAYQAELAAHGVIPDVWSFHAHSDVNAFQAGGPDNARIARYYLTKLQGPWANARIWIAEIGARFRDPSGVIWGDASQAEATSFLLGLATLDARIDAIYYYNYSNQCAMPARCAIQDRGLVSPAPFDGQPPTYDAYDRPRAAWNVIANRGPVIQPAQLVPPVVAITSPAQSAALNTPTPTFSGQAAVGGRAQPTVTLQIFSGTGATQSSTALQTLYAPVAADGSWSVTIAPLPDGAYTARASQVGNRSSSGISEDAVFTIDTVAPTSTVTGPPPVTGARSARLTLTASEPGATFACSVDGGRYRPCASPLRLERVPLGRHRVAVRATDPAGNVQARPTVFRWQVASLATVLMPRLADLPGAVTSGLPVSASCADSCTIGARLYMPREAAERAGVAGRGVSRHDPARPKERGYLTVASDAVKRPRAGTATLALRLRAASASTLARTGSLTVRLGLVVTPKRAAPYAITRRITLVRAGALRTLASGGLPVTVACTSACDATARLWVTPPVARALRAPGRSVAGSSRNGLPRGRYVSLAVATARRSDRGERHLTLTLPRAVRARLPRVARVPFRAVSIGRGPGTPARSASWPLTLAR